MSRRDKTRFEKWFSVSRHKRRSGAKDLSDHISIDFSHQKKIVIDGDKVQYTHGSSNNLDEHFRDRYDILRQFQNRYDMINARKWHVLGHNVFMCHILNSIFTSIK